MADLFPHVSSDTLRKLDRSAETPGLLPLGPICVCWLNRSSPDLDAHRVCADGWRRKELVSRVSSVTLGHKSTPPTLVRIRERSEDATERNPLQQNLYAIPIPSHPFGDGVAITEPHGHPGRGTAPLRSGPARLLLHITPARPVDRPSPPEPRTSPSLCGLPLRRGLPTLALTKAIT